jgi:hypothetical protein
MAIGEVGCSDEALTERPVDAARPAMVKPILRHQLYYQTIIQRADVGGYSNRWPGYASWLRTSAYFSAAPLPIP